MDDTNETRSIPEPVEPKSEKASILVVDASVGDVDESGHVATALFVGVILMVLVLIYTLASAAYGSHV